MSKLYWTFLVSILIIFGGYFILKQNNPPIPAIPSNSVKNITPTTPPSPDIKIKPATPKPTPKPNPSTVPPSTTSVCNTSLINSDGFDTFHVISREACDLVNNLYTQGKAAGNNDDIYENRDGLHVNFCEGWMPNPDCPLLNRFFPQHQWLFSGGVGRATDVHEGVTVGQASYSGETNGSVKYSIAYSMYENESGADIIYNQYTHNNLYIYPSLNESTADNIANTPYVISSEDIAKAGTDYYHPHDASGSDLPFVKIALLGLSALKPDVKQALSQKAFLMPTLEMLIRHSYRLIHSESDYLGSTIHDNTSHANYLSNGSPAPNYDSLKLVQIANGLTLAEIPPLVQLKVLSESFTAAEKIFTTPGAIARNVSVQAPLRTITVSAKDSVDLDGSTANHLYVWKILKGDVNKIKISENLNVPGEATIEFTAGAAGHRSDVGVFVKKQNSTYYSVPGIISIYVHG